MAELEKMTNEERLEVIEQAIHLMRAGAKRSPAPGSKDEMERRLREAAERMRDEYLTDPELTAFSVLDSEDFHDA